jgi:hypothetical protein
MKTQILPYEKFLFIEDGSVDTDSLILELGETNPEIKVVVFRQGSVKPELVNIEKFIKGNK